MVDRSEWSILQKDFAFPRQRKCKGSSTGEEDSVLHKEPLTDADWKLLLAYFADAGTTRHQAVQLRLVSRNASFLFSRNRNTIVALRKDALQSSIVVQLLLLCH